MRKKLFRRIFNDENIPDDDLLHIFFDSSTLRLDITVYDSDIYSAYSKFFAAYSQAKRRRIFPKDLASFIDSFLVDPRVFNIHTCHPLNTTNDRYYFDFDEDEDHIYIWLNVYLKFFRGDNFMDEKSNTPVVPQVPEETERIGAAQISDSQESSLDTCDTALMPSSTTAVSTETVSTTIVSHNDIGQPTIESLTLEIKFHLNQMGFHVIEVGKRLIQAKEMLPHGEWATWLQNNFQLKKSAAYNFMHIAERFGKNESDSNFQTSGSFDISIFKPSQLVELLALPEGDEEKFIADKAAEGNPVDKMTIKQLRSEIKQHKANLQKADHDHNLALVEIAKLQDIVHEQADQIDNLERNYPVPNDYEALEKELAELRDRPVEFAFPDDYESTKQELATLKDREESFKRDYTVTQALNQFFSLLPTLLNADNLQSVVSASADNDLQTLEQQLSQLAAIHEELTNYLTIWKESKHKKDTIERIVVSFIYFTLSEYFLLKRVGFCIIILLPTNPTRFSPAPFRSRNR